MENASKALLIAAGVLMGVLILSLTVYVFSSLGSSAEETYNIMRQEKISDFNSFYFTYYNKSTYDKVYLTYYDIWNVVNKAAEDSKTTTPVEVKIRINGQLKTVTKDDIKITSIDDISNQSNQKVMENNYLRMSTYSCLHVKVNDTTGYVYEIAFVKI